MKRYLQLVIASYSMLWSIATRAENGEKIFPHTQCQIREWQAALNSAL